MNLWIAPGLARVTCTRTALAAGNSIIRTLFLLSESNIDANSESLGGRVLGGANNLNKKRSVSSSSQSANWISPASCRRLQVCFWNHPATSAWGLYFTFLNQNIVIGDVAARHLLSSRYSTDFDDDLASWNRRAQSQLEVFHLCIDDAKGLTT